ncbi:MAG TPA: hypothetical protein PKA37_09120 [Planctomycetota bacterium]|nr:hypothetical protein [Planctomycetota bacterium]
MDQAKDQPWPSERSRDPEEPGRAEHRRSFGRSALLRASKDLLLVVLLLSLLIERLSKSLYGLRLFFDHPVLASFHHLAGPLEPFLADALLIASGMVGFQLLSAMRPLRKGLGSPAALFLGAALTFSLVQRLFPGPGAGSGRLLCFLALVSAQCRMLGPRAPGSLALLGACLLSLWFVALRWIPPEKTSLLVLEEAGDYLLLLGVGLAAWGAGRPRSGSNRRRWVVGLPLLIAVPLSAWLWPAVWSHVALHVLGLISGGPSVLPKAVLLGAALSGLLVARATGDRAAGIRLPLALLLTSSHLSGPEHEAACVTGALLLLAASPVKGKLQS